MIVAGADLSGQTVDFCLLDPELPEKPFFVRYGTKKKGGDHIEAVRRAGPWMGFMWQRWGDQVGVLWIEDPYGFSSRSVAQLSRMAGVIIGAIPESVSVEMVPASQCRTIVGLPVKSKKSEIVEFATQATDVDFPLDEHMADAFVCALAVLKHGERAEKVRLEVEGLTP